MFKNKPHVVLVSIQSGASGTAEAAIDEAGTMITRLSSNSGAPVKIKDLVVACSVDDKGWWKDTVFGGIVGTLLAIGAIYAWSDAKTYQRHRRASL